MDDGMQGAARTSWLQDEHLHIAVTIDGLMTELEACERASLLGINEIAFTNHVMLNQTGYRMTAESLLEHWNRIQACQLKFPALQIRLGLEKINPRLILKENLHYFIKCCIILKQGHDMQTENLLLL